MIKSKKIVNKNRFLYSTVVSCVIASLTNELYIGKGRTPPNGPSTTGNPSGGGRGNNPPSK